MNSNDLDEIRQAAGGDSGDTQKAIAEHGLAVVSMLLKKNRDYGNSAFQSPLLAPLADARTGIQVRMSDKVARLQNLLAGNPDSVGESACDTMMDLAGYAILWLAEPDGGLKQ